MMDISMYGNHHTSSGFQSPELGSGGYPYFSGHHHHHHHMNVAPHPHHLIGQPQSGYQAQIPNNASATNSSTIPAVSESSNVLYTSANASAHPHLYSPTAIEYGITTSSNNSPSDQYYESGEVQTGYYNSGGSNNGASGGNMSSPGTSLPENHIISSDNGLSYTNLDYIAYQQSQGYSMVHGPPDDKSHIPHHYNDDIMIPAGQTPIHSHHSAGTPTWHHHSHGYVDSPGQLQHQLNLTSLPPNSMQAQQQMNHSLHSPSGIQSAQSTSPNLQTQSQQSQQQQQQQQNVPTYKWMQVKRNVPKPQSE